jgi:hypothetical protein
MGEGRDFAQSGHPVVEREATAKERKKERKKERTNKCI